MMYSWPPLFICVCQVRTLKQLLPGIVNIVSWNTWHISTKKPQKEHNLSIEGLVLRFWINSALWTMHSPCLSHLPLTGEEPSENIMVHELAFENHWQPPFGVSVTSEQRTQKQNWDSILLRPGSQEGLKIKSLKNQTMWSHQNTQKVRVGGLGHDFHTGCTQHSPTRRIAAGCGAHGSHTQATASVWNKTEHHRCLLWGFF